MQEETTPQQNNLTLDARLEALLFFKGEPVKKKKLAELLEITGPELEQAILSLEQALSGRGLRIIHKEDVLELRTAPEASALIETLIKEDLHRDLGKAGVETLAIIAYKAPVAKRDIDFIRGVNSSFILRNLMVRGLIERSSSRQDARSFVYSPTTDLLGHLGIERINDLPEYESVQQEIKAFYENEKTTETLSEKNPD